MFFFSLHGSSYTLLPLNVVFFKINAAAAVGVNISKDNGASVKCRFRFTGMCCAETPLSSSYKKI